MKPRIKVSLAAMVLTVAGWVALAQAATFSFYNVDNDLVSSATKTNFTSSTVSGAFVNLGAGKQPASDDLLQTLRSGGLATVTTTGDVRSSYSSAALSDAPGASGGGASTVMSNDNYGTAATLDITFANPAALHGYDLTKVNVYILNIYSGAADWRNEYLFTLSYSTVEAPSVFIPLAGAYQRFEDADAKTGALLEFSFTEDVANVATLRLVNRNGNDGTRWRKQGQSTSFQEIDVFGAPSVPEPATMALLGLGGLAAVVRRKPA